MGSFFSFLIALDCVNMVLCQCPITPGPVTIIGTAIADNAYTNCQTVTSLVVASSLTSIGK